MKSSIFRNAGLDNETLTQLTRLLIPHMVVAIPFKISNIHWPVCGYLNVSAILFRLGLMQNTRLYSFIFNGEVYHEDNFGIRWKNICFLKI
jgi:hypothetical protein